jgi:hypothetical protein
MNDSILYLQLEPKFITDLNRIFEGYEYLAMVTTVDNKKAIVKLIGTPDTRPEVEKVVAHLPFPAKILRDFVE